MERDNLTVEAHFAWLEADNQYAELTLSAPVAPHGLSSPSGQGRLVADPLIIGYEHERERSR